MPDLNWKNPEVRHAMTEIAKYWLEKGIDGLRLDAFIHIAKADLRQNFPVNDKSEEPVVAEPFSQICLKCSNGCDHFVKK